MQQRTSLATAGRGPCMAALACVGRSCCCSRGPASCVPAPETSSRSRPRSPPSALQRTLISACPGGAAAAVLSGRNPVTQPVGGGAQPGDAAGAVRGDVAGAAALPHDQAVLVRRRRLPQHRGRRQDLPGEGAPRPGPPPPPPVPPHDARRAPSCRQRLRRGPDNFRERATGRQPMGRLLDRLRLSMSWGSMVGFPSAPLSGSLQAH